jgi:hypothetical protein
MSESQPESNTDLRTLLCTWCSTALNQSNAYSNVLCHRCYRILIAAGLPDEEIFCPHISESAAEDNFDPENS